VSMLHAGFFEELDEIDEQAAAEREESQGEEEEGRDCESRSFGIVEGEYMASGEDRDEEDEGEIEVKESVLEEMM